MMQMENQTTPNSRLALFVGGFKDGERSRRDTWPVTLQFKRLITPGGNQRPVETYRLGHIHTSHGPFAVYVHDSIEAGGAIFELLAGYKMPAQDKVFAHSPPIDGTKLAEAKEERGELIRQALEAMLPDLHGRLGEESGNIVRFVFESHENTSEEIKAEG
jgi:hypothetical protein